MGKKPCKGFGIKDGSSLHTSVASSRLVSESPPEEINLLAMDGMTEEEEEDDEGGEALAAMAIAEVNSSVDAPNEDEYYSCR